MRVSVYRIESFRRIAAAIFTCGILLLSQSSIADSLSRVRDDAFYHQLIKLPESDGYMPTRSFTIIVDTERGNQLVAEDDPNLRFNMLWMEQFKPGYRTRRGGAAFGMMFRTYLQNVYKAYRERDDEALGAFPNENGAAAKDDVADIADSLDYGLKLTGDEVRFKIQYSY